MASLFVTRNDVARQRAVSNGGLGGFVTLRSFMVTETQQGDGKATWPKNRRKKKNIPSPISIVQESDKFFVKQELLSPTPIADDCFQQSPRTPLSRYNALFVPSSVYSNHVPQPPLISKEQSTQFALELPGSLLLPSQGFPQSNPPCTPARAPACFSRTSSEESDRLWTPAVSISSATDIDDDEMPKSLPLKHLPRAVKPGAGRNFSAPAAQELAIGKPVSAMGADELLEELSQMSPEAVKDIWIPAMVKQYDRLKKLLQDAAERRLNTGAELHDFGQTLESLSRDAHKISHTYEKAVKSAESLVERDARSCRDRLEVTQNNLAAALTTIDNNHQTIRQKDETIQQLRYTLDDVVRVLGGFIHDRIPIAVMRDDERDDVRNVIQMIEDYSISPSKDYESIGRFLRVPEKHYMANIDALSEAHLKTERFREVAISQDQMISKQSKQLDERLIAYGKSLETIAERSRKVESLTVNNQLLRKEVDAFEKGTQVSKSTRAIQDQLYRDQETMQSKMRDMEASHAHDLKRRDTVIAKLERMLGSAEEEVLRSKADVKNVITHTQALLSPAELPEDFILAPPTLKERRLMSKVHGKMQGLPANQTMSLAQCAHEPQASTIPERHQPANVLARPVDRPMYAMLPRDIAPQRACGMFQKQSGRDLRDLSSNSPNYAPRLRTDDLGYDGDQARPASGDHAVASAVVSQMLGAAIKFDPNKRLPNRPEPHYALDLYSGNDGLTMDEAQNWYQEKQQPQAHSPKDVPCPPITQRKRVLSHITERSGEESISEKASEEDTTSATSSAQEEYMNSLHAMQMRDFIKQTNDMTMKGKERDDKPDYEGRDYSPIELEPPDVGTTQKLEMRLLPANRLQHAKNYQNSQDGSSSTVTKKNSPLRDVEGISVTGDPWLSGSPKFF